MVDDRPAYTARPSLWQPAGHLLLAGLLLVSATVSGALLLAIAENGNASLHTLVLEVALPAGGVILVVAAACLAGGRRSLGTTVLAGLGFGAVATLGLELVRNVGFYEFQSMPGQIPELMGVLITNRIMVGPDLVSNVIGWADHFWNGAMFGVTYALVVGGFPRSRGHRYGAAFGGLYGLLLGTGFLLSPVSRATGAGIFGSIFGAKYVITVYLAHVAFGASLGWLVHRFGARLEPIWSVMARLVRRTRSQPGQGHLVTADEA